MRELTDDEVFGTRGVGSSGVREMSDEEVFGGTPSGPPLKTPTLLPLRRGASGDIEFTTPQIVKDLWDGVEAPGKVLKGEIPPTTDALTRSAWQTVGAIETGAVGVPRALVPAGAHTMNAIGPPAKAAAKAVKEAATSVVEPIINRMDPEGAAARSLLRAIRANNPGMPDHEAIAATELQLKRLRPSGGILADTGKGAQKLGRNMAQAPGETAQFSEGVLNARRAGEKTAVIESVKKNISNKDFYDAAAEASKGRKAAGPLFQEAYAAHPNVSNDHLRLMVQQDPAIREAMNKGLALERRASTEAGEEFKPETFGVITQFNEAGDPIITEMQQTPLKLWHATKRGLDVMLAKKKNALGKLDTTDPEVGSLVSLRKALDRELKTVTGGEQGTYARANRMAAESYKLEEALDAGRAFARGDEEITERTFRRLTPKEQQAYRTGVAREIVAMIRKTSSNLTPAQVMSAVQDEAGLAKKLAIIAPSKKQHTQFLQDLQNRLAFRETDRATRNVSQTASILQEEGAIAGDALDNARRAGGMAVDLGRGNVAGAAMRLIDWGADQMRRLKMPVETRNRIGKLLYSQAEADQDEALRLMRRYQNPVPARQLSPKEAAAAREMELKGVRAVQEVLRTKSDVLGAMDDPELGPIDFRHGDKYGGFMKISGKHGEKAALDTPTVIAFGTRSKPYINDRNKYRMEIRLGRKVVVLNNDYQGQRGHWVLSAYDEGKGG